MAVRYLSQENAFELHQTVELNSAVFGYNQQVSVVVRELKRFHNMVDHHLVLHQEGIGVVDNDVVSILAHYSELLVHFVHLAWNSVSEGNMNEFRWKFKVQHLDW